MMELAMLVDLAHLKMLENVHGVDGSRLIYLYGYGLSPEFLSVYLSSVANRLNHWQSNVRRPYIIMFLN